MGEKYRQLTENQTGEIVQSSSEEEIQENVLYRIYRRMMNPLIHNARARWSFLVVIFVLLIAALATIPLQWVKVKMLPFDNKSEFQVIINMPEGASLERTTQCAREIAAAIRTVPEVLNYQVYAGIAAPFNFNGLVRHYFLRRGANVADIQVNLVPKHQRKRKSHQIAKAVRPMVAAIAAKYNARATVAEIPPGPPVLQTLVAEIYGPTEKDRLALAKEIIRIFKNTEGVVDVDWYFEAPQEKLRFVIDREKAALNGISVSTIAQTLQIATQGMPIDLVHMPNEKEDVNLVLEVPRSLRSKVEDLLCIRLGPMMPTGVGGNAETGTSHKVPMVPLRELVHVVTNTIEKSIYHKNLQPVTYVVGDVAGVIESPVYAILKMNKELRKLDMRKFGGTKAQIQIYNFHWPFTLQEPSIKWDGEWHITIRVFRDLGIAFGAVLILIYILIVGWFQSFLTPLIIMAVIPFSLIGILPTHGLMHAFFTATSMIGFMAGAGIVVRNSIILVDFIELRLAEGKPIDQAAIDAGAIRFRPIFLTAMAVAVGASVILLDPIFQGMAISLMAGEVISVIISPVTIPLLYYIFYAKNPPVKPGSSPHRKE